MPVYEEKEKVNGKTRYFIRTYVEDINGKKKQITKHNKNWIGRNGKTEAQEEEIRLKNKKLDSVEDITLSILIDKFLEYKKPMVKFSTYQKIEQDINYYISSHFPTYKKINTITTRDVLNWQKELNKLELSISTKKRTHTTFCSIMKYGCTFYDLEKNVVQLVDNFKVAKSEAKKEMNFLTLDEFEDARLEYNSRQVREDRKIKDYFTHVSNNTKSDLACEIIIELGDMEFWGTKDITYKKKMTNVFEEQVQSLEELVPNFKIASAIIHYDEKSPHLHIIGVPIKYQNKYGMKKQVGKSSVFTKESLSKIQDKIRLLSIDSFNKEYQTNYKLKPKLKGRNKDYHITEMDNYQQMKDNIEIHQRNLKLIEEKNNDLANKTKEIEEILKNLKSKGFVKSELVLKVVDRDKMIAFINLVDKTIIEYQSVAELTATLKELESELLSNRDRLTLLEQNNEDLSLKDNSLTKNIKEKDEEISELKKENLNLKSLLEKLKDKFYFIKHFIITKILDYKEKDKYVQLTRDLHEHRGLYEDDYKELINFSKPINSSRDYITKEKDDYER